eukprot:1143655-Pelagomonas_calceolata.AAC.12
MPPTCEQNVLSSPEECMGVVPSGLPLGSVLVIRNYGTQSLPVVPLVYMMVHRSSGLGGTGSGRGWLRPLFNKSSQDMMATPIACTLCEHMRSGA